MGKSVQLGFLVVLLVTSVVCGGDEDLDFRAQSNRGDCYDKCVQQMTEELGDKAVSKCVELCNDLFPGPPDDGNAGTRCSTTDNCEGDLKCHPRLRVCTKPCSGYCSGENSFCSIAIVDFVETPVCMNKATSEAECNKEIRWESSTTGYAAKEELIFADRFNEGSSAPDARERVCRPLGISWSLSSGGGGGCFVAGTLVDTPQGPRPIETIAVGDEVYSYDRVQRQTVVGRVAQTHYRPIYPVGTFVAGDGTTFVATPDHPIYAENRDSFIFAESFSGGDTLLRRQDQSVQNQELLDALGFQAISFASFTLHTERAPVYNFTVGTYNTYYVHGILVHNRE